MLKESIKMSWSNIVHNKMRSFLTVLGVVIGVASIIALVTIVQGATASVTSQITALGADRITVQAMGTPLKQGLSEQDLARLAEIASVSGVSPTISGKTSVIFNQVVSENLTIQGKNEVYFRKNADTLATGRIINALDVRDGSLVAVIGSQVSKDLFFGTQPVGSKILLNGMTYTVVGVLKEQSGFSLSSTNDAVLVPYTSAMKTLGIRNIMSVDLYMSDATQSDAIIVHVKNLLNEAFNYHDNTYSVFNMQDMISTIGSITGMMSLLLAGIASISLIVGGIGIM
ncbi:MAG TPA: ABC transporter permease, partial [Clostridia bacterium]